MGRWTAASGVINIGVISQTVAVSADGRTIVGTAKDASGIGYAAIWMTGEEPVTISAVTKRMIPCRIG